MTHRDNPDVRDNLDFRDNPGQIPGLPLSFARYVNFIYADEGIVSSETSPLIFICLVIVCEYMQVHTHIYNGAVIRMLQEVTRILRHCYVPVT